MVQAIRDQWVIAIALVAVAAVVLWLLIDYWTARGRRGGRRPASRSKDRADIDGAGRS